LDSIKARLTREGMAYTTSKSGRQAIFFYDWDGNAVELIQAE
jgi:Tol biopolymer transport system component